MGTNDHGRLVCVSAPKGTTSPPSCTTALTSDGNKLLCTPVNTATEKDQSVSAALQQLDVVVYNMQLQLQPQLAVPPTSYVGLSATGSCGDFFSGLKTVEGVGAAGRICTIDFGSGAHLCTIDELYQAVVNGTLKATDTIPQSWVYMPNWNTPLPNAETPLEGLADNCGGYSYQLSSRQWRGILVEWGPLPDGTPGFRWHGGQDRPGWVLRVDAQNHLL